MSALAHPVARYAVPMLLLSGCVAAFFAPRRFRPLPARRALATRVIAAVPLVASGTLHLLRPAAFVALLPPPFPPSTFLIMATGVPELLGAAGLFVPKLRRLAAASLAVFLVAILPANIYVAGQTVAGLPMPGVPARTAMQAAYMLLVLLAGWGRPVRASLSPNSIRLNTIPVLERKRGRGLPKTGRHP